MSQSHPYVSHDEGSECQEELDPRSAAVLRVLQCKAYLHLHSSSSLQQICVDLERIIKAYENVIESELIYKLADMLCYAHSLMIPSPQNILDAAPNASDVVQVNEYDLYNGTMDYADEHGGSLHSSSTRMVHMSNENDYGQWMNAMDNDYEGDFENALGRVTSWQRSRSFSNEWEMENLTQTPINQILPRYGDWAANSDGNDVTTNSQSFLVITDQPVSFFQRDGCTMMFKTTLAVLDHTCASIMKTKMEILCMIERISSAEFTFNPCYSNLTPCYLTVTAKRLEQMQSAVAILDFFIKYNIELSYKEAVKIVCSEHSNLQVIKCSQVSSKKIKDKKSQEEQDAVMAIEITDGEEPLGPYEVAMPVEATFFRTLCGAGGKSARFIEYFTGAYLSCQKAQITMHSEDVLLIIGAEKRKSINAAIDLINILRKNEVNVGNICVQCCRDFKERNLMKATCAPSTSSSPQGLLAMA
ncbi:hypothetical protein TTRE_0000785001 [Trichuris trichiura]|uniref:K Homology domain-containing protein n=1 Tax=Trichuris trichiura TaxID=36087 RepID=A0A077ZLH9_TRITR|nr:hypothetical protein TTRE_0000785001 [Trichuris trichiura]